jgi:PleD family two-component response regulator
VACIVRARRGFIFGTMRSFEARVLVASDDAWRRWTLCGWLSYLGAGVRQVAGAAEALDTLAEGTRFDLVIADLRATAPDGVWLAATMRGLALDSSCLLLDEEPLDFTHFATSIRRVLAARLRHARNVYPRTKEVP